MLYFHVPVLTGLTVALAWKLYQLSRAPDDRALRAAVTALVCAIASNTSGVDPVRAWIDAVLATGTAKVAESVLLAATLLALKRVFQYRAGARVTAADLAVFGGTVLTLAGLTWATPAVARGHTIAVGDVGVAQVALYYIVASAYYLYLMTTTGVWAWHYARQTDRHTARGLRMVSVGLAVLVVPTTARIGAAVARWSGTSVSALLIPSAMVVIAVGIVVFLAGLTYPGAVSRVRAIQRWRHHRSSHAKLQALWLLMHRAYPRTALHGFTPALQPKPRILRHVNPRFERRLTECRDGLVYISPYLAQFDDDDQLADMPPEPLAERLCAALRARASGQPPPARGPAVPIALPTGSDLDSEIDRLTRLSQALEPHVSHIYPEAV